MEHLSSAARRAKVGAVTGPRAVLLTGPLGSGKTSVAITMGRLLDAAGVPNAVVDLDWLCWVGPDLPTERLRRVMCDNLAAVRTRYLHDGVETLVLARSVTGLEEVEAVRAAAGGFLVAFRLSVPPDVAASRLAARDDGDDDLSQADALAAADARLPLPAVRNHGRTMRETAAEILDRLGWLA